MPRILDSCVQKKIKEGMDKSQAFAVCTSSLQDAGILKRGTSELTEKGKRRNTIIKSMKR